MQQIETPGGVRYLLGPRPIGKWRWAGIVPMLMGLAFVGGGVAFTVSAWQGGAPAFVALVGLVFAAFGLGPIWLGLVVMAGQTEVELTHDRLRVRDRVGPFGRWRSRRLDQLTRFQISAAKMQQEGAAEAKPFKLPGTTEELGALGVHTSRGRQMTVGFGYPKSQLKELAGHLSESAEQTAAPRPGAASSSIAVEEADEHGHRQDTGTATLADQPAGSTIEVSEHESGLTLRVPPSGLWRGSKGLFFFALLWCGFMTLFTTFVLAQGAFDLIFLAFIVAFWGIGVGLLVAAINMGRRQAILDIVGDTLLVTRQNLFGTRQDDWPRESIQDICFAPSGSEVNDRPIMHLEIRFVEGKPVGLFSERDDEELRWLAGLLRGRLGITSPADAEPEAASTAEA